MQIKSRVLIVFLLFLLFGHLYLSSANSDDLEWRVNVGDTMTYVYTKVYGYNVSDPDPTYVKYMSVTAINGTPVELAYTSGTKFSVEIIQIEGQYATTQITMDGVTYEPEYGSFVSQTTDNLTYWEDLVRRQNSSSSFLNANISFDGYEYIIEGLIFFPQLNESWKSIYKRNWKTGWYTYIHVVQDQNISGELVVISELELMIDSSNGIPGFTVFSFIYCFPIVLILTRHFTKKKF
ncbi:hypothetical protein CEE45_02790 [Candidatus Heimdallarchaeota archaeon B3_Heim]|nr:MAG: hypothetical protein CEE45_02790 [Candidatus Heimdallarchaeota archaeon B3_Heim]